MLKIDIYEKKKFVTAPTRFDNRFGFDFSLIVLE